MKDEDVLGDLEFSTISEEEATWLDMLFPKDEVLFIVFQGFDGDKTPRPDGFSMAFFFFPDMFAYFKIGYYGLISEFPCPSCFREEFECNLPCSHSKKVEAMEVRYFRPISLVGGVYKINSMVLANRLRKVLLGIILESQNANVTNK